MDDGFSKRLASGAARGASPPDAEHLPRKPLRTQRFVAVPGQGFESGGAALVSKRGSTPARVLTSDEFSHLFRRHLSLAEKESAEQLPISWQET